MRKRCGRLLETNKSANHRSGGSKDRGIIVLIGERFTQHPYVDLFPEDWYNKDPQELIQQDAFRSDLYYRLNGFVINLPPLSERIEDIPLLARNFLHKYGYHSITGFSKRTMELLQSYSWPGNIRELENTIRRSALLALAENRSLIREEDLPEEIQQSSSYGRVQNIHKPLDVQIIESLRRFKFSRSSITQTAQALGNRDRGTITEYFRGLCFEQLVNSNYDKQQAAVNLAKTDDPEIIQQVMTKMENYLQNLSAYAGSAAAKEQKAGPFQGLPKKYHPFLTSIMENIYKIS